MARLTHKQVGLTVENCRTNTDISGQSNSGIIISKKLQLKQGTRIRAIKCSYCSLIALWVFSDRFFSALFALWPNRQLCPAQTHIVTPWAPVGAKKGNWAFTKVWLSTYDTSNGHPHHQWLLKKIFSHTIVVAFQIVRREHCAPRVECQSMVFTRTLEVLISVCVPVCLCAICMKYPEGSRRTSQCLLNLN